MSESETPENSQPESKKTQRAKRLKILRKMTGLKMQDFAEICNVGFTTMNYWENAFEGGLTDRGARKVTDALRSEGIVCSTSWLMEGSGELPKIVDQTKLSKLNQELFELTHVDKQDEEFIIHASLKPEIDTFQQSYPDNLIYLISDDSMAPLFQKGDVVGGKKLEGNQREFANDHDCIIDTGDDNLIVRHVKLGSQANTFSLYCLNPVASLTYPPAINIRLAAIAPINRIWRNIKD